MKEFNEKGDLSPKFEIGSYALHGDVIVERINSVPKDFKKMDKSGDGALAYGKATGHLHKLFDGEFDLRECPKTKIKYLRIVEPVMLKHQEHDKIKLPPGDYKIGIQREYSPYEKLTRRVVD